MIVPRILSQAPLTEIGRGGPPAMPLAIVTPDMLGGELNNGDILAGVTVTSPQIKVAGYNAFMWQTEISIGGTVALNLLTYTARDGYATQAFSDLLIAAQAPTFGRGSWGAFSSIRNVDLWDVFAISATGGGGVGVQDFFVTLYFGVR